jgi:uncharacterized protein
MAESIPLFPLGTVLFPDGPLRLRIFEPRYVDMIGRCMRENTGFGVALITEGREAGGPARTTEVGTLARIVDFERLEDGLLGITARGERRFRIVAVSRQSDGLNIAEVEWLDAEPAVPVPHDREILAELTRHAFERVGAVYGDVPTRFEDATWVGMRLAEILPLSMPERQQCLEMMDALARLDFVRERLDTRQD